MPIFKNVSQLQAYIKQESIKALQNEVGEKIKEILQKHVNENLYDAYSEGVYKRTYELVNSVTVGVTNDRGNTIELEVYFDPYKMNHTSLFGSEKLGISIGERVYIAQWVNDGFTWNRPEVGYLESAIEELLSGAKPHIKTYMDSMKSKGIKFV